MDCRFISLVLLCAVDADTATFCRCIIHFSSALVSGVHIQHLYLLVVDSLFV
jgi:hypothetical protein